MSGRGEKIGLSDVLEGVNLPDLIASLAGGDAVRGLTREHGGVICDPRPGMGERHPSFSVYRRESVWWWKRHGGDEGSGTAYHLLVAFGYSHSAAWEELARWAGQPARPWTRSFIQSSSQSDPLAQAQAVLERCKPFSEAEAARINSLVAPLREGSAAARELRARGLLGWPGLDAGELRRDFIARDGRQLAQRGALAFTVRGPDGQPWALKVRNAGSADQLEALDLCRYVYRIGGHGAPAWCSPGYGSADSVLIPEGELSAAAASRAATEAGLDLDVQGLAGAGGTPFLEGLAGKVVYLYADPDAAGVACLERLGRLARCAGAREVKVLAALERADYCDIAGGQGIPALARILTEQIRTSTTVPTISPSGARGSAHHTTTPNPSQWGDGESSTLESAPMKKYLARLSKKMRGGR